jgi:hypothetical protein
MSHLRSPRAMIWPTLRAIEISSLARRRGTLLAHCQCGKAGIHQLIGGKASDRPSVIAFNRSSMIIPVHEILEDHIHALLPQLLVQHGG